MMAQCEAMDQRFGGEKTNIAIIYIYLKEEYKKHLEINNQLHSGTLLLYVVIIMERCSDAAMFL